MRVEAGADALDPAFDKLDSRPGRRGPRPATACGATCRVNASS